MNQRLQRAVLGVSLMILPCAIARAEDAPAKTDAPTKTDAPATRPQTPPGAGQGFAGRAQIIMQRDRGLVDNIKLTDEQKTKIDAIYDEATTRLQSMAGELQNSEPRDRFQKLFGVLNDNHAKVSAVLTDEQKTTYEDNLARAREDMRGRFGRRGGPPTSAPSTPTPPNAENQIRRVRESIAKLDLTDDQKTQVNKVLDDMDAKMLAIKDELQNNPDTGRTDARNIFADAREKLQTILTPDQQQKLRAMLQPPPQNGDGNSPPKTNGEKTSRRPTNDRMANDKMADETMTDDRMAMRAGGDRPAAIKPRISDAPSTPLVKTGQTAPDFAVKKLDGSPATLASFKDHVTVLIFGSYTTPTFRERAAEIERLAADYTGRADFLVVYTKESHPAGGWEVERNKDDKVKIEQPKTQEERIAVAKKARDVLKLSLPFAVDSDSDAVATAYGTFPNGAVILSRDGTVAYAQHWCDPATLRRHLDATISPKAVADAK